MKDTRLQQLFKILAEAETYSRAIGKLEFDMSCVAPPAGLEQAGEDMAALGRRLHSLTHSKRYVKLITSLREDPGELTLAQRKTVEHLYDAWEKSKNQSAAFAYERDRCFHRAYGDWLRAKQASDFSLFRESLNNVVDFTRRDIDLRDKKLSSYYHSCLDDYEKGGSEAQLDAFFAALKERIVPLLGRIMTRGKSVRTDFLSRPCPIAQQEAFSHYLLELEGLRQDALVLMTTEHPFTTSFGPRDVRVTTHYYEDAFLSNIFSTLHEGGHALFMQNEPEEFYGNFTHDSMTSAMHECISRFYENIIGRSQAFVSFIAPKLRQISPDLLEGVSDRELYEGVNAVHPSLIRIEADELTYGLHIMIRYEIEKELVNGRITVDQVPALWNAKYREYLGVEVPDDARGCLQDVHWSSGFGYFPSYALGNTYGAQILRTMEKDFDVFGAVSRGELGRILDWLRERVFSIASVTDPDEWIRAITGESLDPQYFLDYLEEKYTGIYGL